MSKETELSEERINGAVESVWGQGNRLPRGPLFKFARAVIAADRELRQHADPELAQLHANGAKAWADVPNATAWVDELRGSHAIDTSTERVEKQGGNVQMPVIAWVEPEYEDHFGCDGIQAYRSEKPGWEALVRQSDAQVALAAKDAEIDALKKQVGAYKRLTASLDVRIATMRARRSDWQEAIGTLASERLANAMLTNEIDALKADAERVRADAGFPVSGLVAIEMPESDAEAKCKPSLYLFWSAHGGIRYWTRDAAAAARKAIEFGTEPERLYAATVPAPAQLVALPAGMPEPDAYMFQHEETGLVQFVDAQQVEWGFEESNPRLKRIDAVYTAAQVQAMLTQGLAPGWKAVPVEPTMKMISALGFGGDEDLAIGHASISAGVEKAYRAMLEAAPAPEQAHGIKAQ